MIMSQPGKPAAFVVIPEFVVKPDCVDAFLSLAQDDASHSLADEPGCQQFDVVQMEGAPHKVLFYEVYGGRDGCTRRNSGYHGRRCPGCIRARPAPVARADPRAASRSRRRSCCSSRTS